MKALGFQPVESTSLSKLWFQIVNLHPYNVVPKLVPTHIEGVPPTYYIVAGIVFTTVCVPYLKSEYGKDYDYDAPVKLLDRMMHDQVKVPGVRQRCRLTSG